MGFTELFAEPAILGAGVLVWAAWSKLDLGLRAPVLSGVWPWIALYVAWIGVEGVIVAAHPVETDPEWLRVLDHLSFAEELAIAVVLSPIFEELLFRGAMFAALMRRWGIWVATIVPSLLWGLLHVQYEFWFACSIAGSGFILAMIRWKSDSLYVPLVLHAGYNLYALMMVPTPIAPATGL